VERSWSASPTPPTTVSVARIGSHYDQLGVTTDASEAEIRAAYRRLARAHHPDRRGGASAERMSAINAAYRVLRDPARRAVYDASLREPVEVAAGRVDDADPPPVRRFDPLARYHQRPRYPWRPMLVLAVVGTVLVFATSALRSDPQELPPDNLLRPGSCVSIDPNGDAREVPCSTEDVLIVEQLVPFDGVCPDGTEPHRDRQGMGIACVAPSSPPN
jgi:hypothetical protein